jgi:ferrous iron transport protein A
MERNFMTLTNLPLNTKGYINSLNCSGNIRRRLLDLGLVKNSSITPVLISPSGDPRAFEVRGTLVAIRKEDTNLIHIHL